MHRARTIAQIRHLTSFGPLLGRPRTAPKRLPRQLQPDGIRLEYFKAIRPICDMAHKAMMAELGPIFHRLEGEGKLHADAEDDERDRAVAAAAHRLAMSFRPEQLERVAKTFGERTDDFQRAQFDRQVRAAMGVSYDNIERPVRDLVPGWVKENVDLIKTVPERYFDRIARDVKEAYAKGTSTDALTAQIQQDYDASLSDAQRIARDQVGKLNGDMNKERQVSLGIEGYIWRGMMDDRERDEHRDLEGEKFSWDDEPEDGHPGEAVQCRCYAEPDFTDIMGGEEEGVVIPQPEEEAPVEEETAPPEPERALPDEVPGESLQETALRDIEGEIVDKAIEHGHIVDEEGQTVLMKTGNANSITFYGPELRAFEDNIFTHNHPNGTSLSPADLNLAIVTNAKGARAIGRGKDGVVRRYSFERPEKGWPGKDEAKRVVNNWNRKVYKREQKKVEETGFDALAIERAQFNHWQKVWEGAAEELGITYRMEVVTEE